MAMCRISAKTTSPAMAMCESAKSRRKRRSGVSTGGGAGWAGGWSRTVKASLPWGRGRGPSESDGMVRGSRRLMIASVEGIPLGAGSPSPRSSPRGERKTWRRWSRWRLAKAHARIEHRIEDVDGEVDDDEHHHGEEEIGDDHRPVEQSDRRDDQPADAGPGEDRLGDDGEGDDGAEFQPDHGDDRDEDVLQHMDEDDAARRQPLGAGEFDVVERQHLARAGAGQADDQRHLEEREVERRQRG